LEQLKRGKVIMTRAKKAKGVEAELRKFALSFPEAREDFPWGERVIKVKGKVFVFMGAPDDGIGISTKLPESAAAALTLPFASPTPYGLGKSGWVSARFAADEQPPVDLLKIWIRESYRAIAPKKLLAILDGPSEATPSASNRASLRSKRSRAARRRDLQQR
jgi:predicted DNA-binding protein (MmcQ/YjbR family)